MVCADANERMEMMVQVKVKRVKWQDVGGRVKYVCKMRGCKRAL